MNGGGEVGCGGGVDKQRRGIFISGTCFQLGIPWVLRGQYKTRYNGNTNTSQTRSPLWWGVAVIKPLAVTRGSMDSGETN